MVNSSKENIESAAPSLVEGEHSIKNAASPKGKEAAKSKARASAPQRAQLFTKTDEHAAEAIEDLNLAELRKALGLSQKELSELLNVSQPAVSKQERRKVIQLDTLSSIINAMGGSLEITATFPDRGKVRLLYSNTSEKNKTKS